MALTPEWEHRIRRWEDALWKSCYRPLGSVELSGFASTLQLTAEQALACSFQPMASGTPWGGKWEYGWFKGEVVLPEEAQGRRIAVNLQPGAVTFRALVEDAEVASGSSRVFADSITFKAVAAGSGASNPTPGTCTQ